MDLSDSAQASYPMGRVPRTGKGRARVDVLKRSAEAIFAAQGYDATTMTDIAARAGASIGSLYQYFPSKAHVARAIQEDGLAALLSALAELRGEVNGPADLAVRMFDLLVDHSLENPAFGVVSNRRDADPAVSRHQRDTTCARIADGLAHAEPSLSASRAMVAAVLIQHLAEAAQARSDAGPGTHALMQSEIRRMLRLYLDDPL
jgi:AcrR family transcriptional regulator